MARKPTEAVSYRDEQTLPTQSIADLVSAVRLVLAHGKHCQLQSEAEHVLTEAELAARWKMSPKSLQRWRFNGTGVRHLKLSRKVVYLVKDVEDFERKSMRSSTSERAEA